MLKEVIAYKQCIESMQKYWKERPSFDQPKMFVLCSTKALPNSRYSTYLHNKSYIRPCNVSFKKYVAACKKCSGLHMMLEGAIADVDFNEVDKSQFLLECAMLGIMPPVEFIDDSDGKAVDEIDLTTGISYLDVRRQVIEKRTRLSEKRKERNKYSLDSV